MAATKMASAWLLANVWIYLIPDGSSKPEQTPNEKAIITCYQCHTEDVAIDCVTSAPAAKPCEMLHKYCFVLVVKDREEGLISLTRGCSPSHMGNGCFPVDEAETRIRCFHTCRRNGCNGPSQIMPFYMHAGGSQNESPFVLICAVAVTFTVLLLYRDSNFAHS